MANRVDINELLSNLTFEEKAGQLMQLAAFFFNPESVGQITGSLTDMGIDEEDVFRAGSVLGISGASELKLIQEKYLEKSRHKIPLVFMADIIHGYRTIFPVPLGLSCSWNLDAARAMAEVSAKEAAVGGVHVTFSPMADLVRDPRWGRVMESTGEDPYLNGLFAKAMVEGYQGDMTGDYNIAACVKHFAAYGASEAGRDYNTVDMSDRYLREYYLPAYKAAIEAGAEMVMTSFNTVDSVPATGNKYLMRDILRGEWGFDGVVISDWGAVNELIPHGLAEDGREAAEKALVAGVDIEMMTSHYVHHLKALVEEGVLTETLIDEAVLRILKLKEKLGLFENPFKVASEEKEKEYILCDEHRKAAREIAGESMVLLKNDGTLPLARDVKRVAVIGPYGDEGDMIGPWHWAGEPEESVTVKEGIIGKIGADRVIYSKGCDIETGSDEGIEAAVQAAREADVVVLALGEHEHMSGESGCRAFIKLPGRQEELAKAVKATGKPVVVVLFNGRPLEITELSGEVNGLLEAWFPGTEGGNAVADILFGDVNPSGRLTMSFPVTVGQIPVYYNHYTTGRPKPFEANTQRYFSQYLDIPNAPLYPFGYGLGYADFQYDDFKLDGDVLTPDGTIKASVRVRNMGPVAGHEVVQLYIRDISGSVVRPVKELKGFEKIHLKANEERIVEFVITEEMLRFHTIDGSFKSEKGKFQAMIGKNAADVMALSFELK